jgi:4-amino-4-deoxy-L-arabinose transferase-like glycosyltransferase
LTGAEPAAATAPRGFSRAARRAAAAIALAATLFSVASLRRYGVTIDEPALLYAGDRTLHALRHPGQPGALDFEAADPPGFRSHFPRLPDPLDPQHYPVLPALVAAATDATLGRAFALSPVDGHHAGLALLSIALLFLYTLYACRLLGDAAGVAAAIALACFPTAVGHAFNDPKDWPCAGFYALTVLAAGVGLLEKRPRHLWLAGVFFGLALSCKQNGVFAAVTVLLATPFIYRLVYQDGSRGRSIDRRLATALLLSPGLGCAIFALAWPWLWWAGPSVALARFGDFLGFARQFSSDAHAGFSPHPFRCLVFMTPPLVLVAAAAGCWPGRRPTRERLAIGTLLTIWLLLPLVRVALPHANFYDANRHFIEYIPALCALAGLGFVEAWRRASPLLTERLERLGISRARALGGAVLAVAAVALVWPVAQYHPFETAYFNLLTGGLGGAQRAGLFRASSPTAFVNGTEGDYWLSSLREGARAAQALTPPGRPLGICAWLPALVAIDNDGPTNEVTAEVTAEVERAEVPVVYAAPRGQRCSWKRLRELERWRPVLERITRGGGLIYEILGPRAALPHAPVSPPTVYDP